MADSVSRKANRRHLKNPKLEKRSEKSKSSTTYGRLRESNPESDEYIRQYLLFHYDFHRTQGFGIEWDKFDFFFPHCRPYDGAPPLDEQTNEGGIREATLDAIADYNEKNGTNILFVEHIEANFKLSSFFQNWITFWAVDWSSPCKEPKIYQAHTQMRTGTFQVPIFRVKPTEEEMAAAPPIHVDPPNPYRFDHLKPYVVFRFAGPGDDAVLGTPFTFERIPPSPPLPRMNNLIHIPHIPRNWWNLQ